MVVAVAEDLILCSLIENAFISISTFEELFPNWIIFSILGDKYRGMTIFKGYLRNFKS